MKTETVQRGGLCSKPALPFSVVFPNLIEDVLEKLVTKCLKDLGQLWQKNSTLNTYPVKVDM